MNAMEEKHLILETRIDGKLIARHELHDPFLHNQATLKMSIVERIKLLFNGRIVFDVRLRGDHEAIRHWFRTDPIPMWDTTTLDREHAHRSSSDEAAQDVLRAAIKKAKGESEEE